MNNRIFKRLILIIFVLGVIFSLAFPFLEEDIYQKVFIGISVYGYLIILLSFFGFENVRQYFFETFFNAYIDDQYEVMMYLSSINNNNELVQKFYKHSNHQNDFFKEAVYMGADSYCNYNKDKVIAYQDIIKKMIGYKLTKDVSEKVLMLNYIKISELLFLNDNIPKDEPFRTQCLNILKKSKNKYVKIAKEYDPILKKLLA